ncbi:hypothetical protein L195_g061841, partial [Trifolium pratense]
MPDFCPLATGLALCFAIEPS